MEEQQSTGQQTTNKRGIVIKSSLLTVVFASLAILIYILIRLQGSVQEIAENVHAQTIKQVTAHLDKFFEPITTTIRITAEHQAISQFNQHTTPALNEQFLPIMKYHSALSAMLVANLHGQEYMLLKDKQQWWTRVINPQKNQQRITKQKWELGDNGLLNMVQELKDTSNYKPQSRPWFRGAALSNPGNLYWTDPYIFYTKQQPGITISAECRNAEADETTILAFDILLTDISSFTKSLDVGEHGMALIISSNGDLVGLPKGSYTNHPDSIAKYSLRSAADLPDPVIKKAFNFWQIYNKGAKPFKFKSDSEYWHAGFSEFKLSPDKSFYIGVLVPESDFLSEMNNTKLVILISFLLASVLTIVAIYFFLRMRKYNQQLQLQNEEITAQKHELNVQQKELSHHNNQIKLQKKKIDQSISYAKRIQDVLLPEQDLINNGLKDHFILLKPKDVVSGDFYWVRHASPITFIVAADCTGHGVPGAFLSILGMSLLNEIAEQQTTAGAVLDKLRTSVKKALKQNDPIEDAGDGMDIALCLLNHENNTLQFAGANNPLYLFRNDKLTEYEGDLMPIGIFRKERPFTNHVIHLEEGDTFYIFSDGFTDQFGGPTGVKFNTPRFKGLLHEIHKRPMSEQKKVLDDTITNWMDNNKHQQVDDIMVIGIKV